MRTCNLHDDCDAADAAVLEDARRKLGPSRAAPALHCSVPGCRACGPSSTPLLDAVRRANELLTAAGVPPIVVTEGP